MIEPRPKELPDLLVAIEDAVDEAVTLTDCDVHDTIALHLVRLSAEITVAHTDLPDDAIAEATLLLPDTPMVRLIQAIDVFAHQTKLSGDAVVDFLIGKMHPEIAPTISTLN